MKKRTNNILTCLLFLCLTCFGQQNYQYKRELKGIDASWHSVILPDEVFEKVSADLSDIRIIGVTEKKDTVEAPYLLKIQHHKTTVNEVKFTNLNTSFTNEGYFYSFKMDEKQPINRLTLNFMRTNFDWKVTLEGSDNGKEWYTILKDSRLVSIKNEATDFTFTTLSFPATNYAILRVLVKSDTDPQLDAASIFKKEDIDGVYRNFTIKDTRITQNDTNNTTEIDLELPLKVPVSQLTLKVNDAFDFYRPISVQYVSDSFQTQQGLRFTYKTLTSGILNSMDSKEFSFKSTVLKKLKIIVYNNDNQPLQFKDFQVKGYEHSLVARFTVPATYYLIYGNKNATVPRYDIAQFTNKIPATISVLKPGKEVKIDIPLKEKKEALFVDETWLWVIMGLILLVLGWFTFKMIKKA